MKSFFFGRVGGDDMTTCAQGLDEINMVCEVDVENVQPGGKGGGGHHAGAKWHFNTQARAHGRHARDCLALKEKQQQHKPARRQHREAERDEMWVFKIS